MLIQTGAKESLKHKNILIAFFSLCSTTKLFNDSPLQRSMWTLAENFGITLQSDSLKVGLADRGFKNIDKM